MNIDNLHELIEYLEELDEEEFNQENFAHPCGTPSCLAGHTYYLMTKKEKRDFYYIRLLEMIEMIGKAGDWLGLDKEQENQLFDCAPLGCYDEPTIKDAINALEHLALTGEVVW